MTRVIAEVAKPLAISVHDHIIVGTAGPTEDYANQRWVLFSSAGTQLVSQQRGKSCVRSIR
jgi:hypothetical protein